MLPRGFLGGLLTGFVAFAVTSFGLPNARADDPVFEATVRHLMKPSPNRGFSVGHLAFSPDGKMLAYVGEGVRILDPKSGKFILSPGDVKGRFGGHVTFFGDGKTLVSGGGDGLRVWNATGTVLSEWDRRAKDIHEIALSRDDSLIPLASGNGSVHLLDAKTGDEKLVMNGHGKRIVTSVSFSPDGKTLASGAQDRTVRLWDVATGKQSAVIDMPGVVYAVAFSPDGKTLAIRTMDLKGGRPLRLWDVATQKERVALPVNASAMAFSPDGRYLATGAGTGKMFDRTMVFALLDHATGKQLATFTSTGQSVQSIAVSPGGSTLAAVCSDGPFVIWDVKAK